MVFVAVVGREQCAVADVVVKDVEAWSLFSQSSSPNATRSLDKRDELGYAFCHGELTAVTTAKEANAEFRLTHSRQSVILRAKPAT